jgi:tRNA(adenine34) deaminase
MIIFTKRFHGVAQMQAEEIARLMAGSGAQGAGERPEDEGFMLEALAEARLAADEGEVPVGAVVVCGGEIVARAHNMTEGTKDPTAHAEMLAIRRAAEVLRGSVHRLTGCSMYVTLEPCAMCAGAVVNARLERLIIGAADPKAGACGSLRDIVRDERLNHRVPVTRGVLEEECSGVLKEFFRTRRAEKKHPKEN